MPREAPHPTDDAPRQRRRHRRLRPARPRPKPAADTEPAGAVTASFPAPGAKPATPPRQPPHPSRTPRPATGPPPTPADGPAHRHRRTAKPAPPTPPAPHPDRSPGATHPRPPPPNRPAGRRQLPGQPRRAGHAARGHAGRATDTRLSRPRRPPAGTPPAPGEPGGAEHPRSRPAGGAGPPPYGAGREHGPTLDLPGGRATASGTIVLGGAAAARAAPPGPRPHRRAGAGRGPPPGPGAKDDGQGPDEPGGRHFRTGAPSQVPAADEADRRRLPSWTLPSWNLVAVAAPIAVVLLLLAGWAVDTAALSGQVVRNVEVAGRPVGGLGEASLPEVMTEIGDELAARKVRVEAEDKVYETTAGELGLSFDAEATSEAALDAGGATRCSPAR